jgi:hypothetical protein
MGLPRRKRRLPALILQRIRLGTAAEPPQKHRFPKRGQHRRHIGADKLNFIVAVGRPIVPGDYFSRDTYLVQLEIMGEYVDLYDYRPSRRPAFEAHFSELKKRVTTDLVRARCLIAQMRQNIYPEDLVESLLDSANVDHRSVKIEAPGLVKTHEAAAFALSFRSKRFNIATACNEITCVWDFGDATT